MLRALTLAVLLTAATSSQAGIITSSAFTPFIELSAGNGSVAQPLLLPYFDSSQGTLDRVFISYFLLAQGSIILDNDSSVSSSFNFAYLVNMETSFPSIAPVLSASLFDMSVTLDSDEGDGYGGRDGGSDEFDFGYNAVFSALIVEFTHPENSDFQAFVKPGSGLFDVGCQLGLRGAFARPDGVELYDATKAACGADVEYHYTETQTPVPEPSIIALFTAGLFGIEFARRKVRS